MIKVGDVVRLKQSEQIVTVQEVKIGDYGYTGYWSDELDNAWYYVSGRRKKNWHNASPTYIEILPRVPYNGKGIKHKFI